jgi:hypothetical protein
MIGCAKPDRIKHKRKIPQPNKHFRLVLWFLLYQVHAQQQITREVEAIACESCRMPLCFFDRFKKDFSHHWNQMLDKRSRRLAHLLKCGEVPGGWTPFIGLPGIPLAIRGHRSNSLTQAMLWLSWRSDQSLTISRNAVGVWAGYQLWIAKHEQSGSQIHTAATERVSLCERMKS